MTMEHIRQFDWCDQPPEGEYFVEEADIDNCNIEKIISGRFRDPLLSSDSEEETHNKIDWDEIFKKRKAYQHRLYVPCLRPYISYPKLSAMNSRQHFMFLKVLSADNPNVLEDQRLGHPSLKDIKDFAAANETYLKEQIEYKAWAKSLWTTDHCIRALRPKPAVETVYEAEFKVKAQRMRSLPKLYDIAAQIPLEGRRTDCKAKLTQELVTVNLTDMPKVQIPEKITKQFTILKPCTVPEPCNKHPYQIVLPNENSISMLPITEIHRELAMYAVSQGTHCIASENALKCLVQHDRLWMIPLSVCETIGPDGDKINVIVLDSEFAVNKESAPMRTLKAFRHLLEHVLIPTSEREELWQKHNIVPKNTEVTEPSKEPDKSLHSFVAEDFEMSSDDDDEDLEVDRLVIDTGDDTDALDTASAASMSKNKTGEDKTETANEMDTDSVGYLTRAVSRRISEDIGVYSCSCKGTIYEKPPRRSYNKWQFQNANCSENYDIIIHSPHKARNETGELILEPIPEYQIDLGASEQSADSIRSMAVSLMLRKNASALYVRVEGPTGEVATIDMCSSEQFTKRHPDVTKYVTNTIHTALDQLQGLLPGHYILQHEAGHGANALLLAPRGGGAGGGGQLLLQFDSAQLAEPDEANIAKAAPIITTDLLPYHKYRKILPCAFTPYEEQLVKEPKKPQPKKKAPPQAIKWPKRRTRRKKKN